jgi:AcrR family transcriptional regulator
VDAEAGTPPGTTTNYFRTRADLLGGLAVRIFERIGPSPERLAELSEPAPSVELFATYIRDIVERLLGARELTLALFELRIEAARNPTMAGLIGATLRNGFEADVAFNAARGLPGGPVEIALMHYAVDGMILDQLSTPIAPGLTTDQVVDSLVRRIMSSTATPG